MSWKDIGDVFKGKSIMKKCFICRGHGHHLSKSQYIAVKLKIRDDLASRNRKTKRPVHESDVEEKAWEHVKESDMLCDICHGNKVLFYPIYS